MTSDLTPAIFAVIVVRPPPLVGSASNRGLYPHTYVAGWHLRAAPAMTNHPFPVIVRPRF
jgi:hypothetical protein